MELRPRQAARQAYRDGLSWTGTGCRLVTLMAELRVALVHDWLTGMRGGERVLLELCRLFPTATVHTLLWNRGSVHPEIEARVRQTSFLQNLPGVAGGYRSYLPLFPAAARSLSVNGADLILSSSHAVAKGVRVAPGVPHVSYVHTPMRYLWDETGSYFQFGTGSAWKRAGLSLLKPYLRRFDVETAREVDHFIANSENVRGRISRFWGAEAVTIPPPVDTDFFTPAARPSDGGYYLIVSSLEPYKRIDLAVEAFRGLPWPLVIAGSGTQQRELRANAPQNVQFVGRVSDRQLRELYRGCRALVFPGVEDFGIVPVEAQACGKAVICYGQGGVTESVVDGVTGIHFRPQQPQALLEAVQRSERRVWDAAEIRRRSLTFSRARFRDRMEAFFRIRMGLSLGPPRRPDVNCP
jgi:glycosyltransferase involved in cell wall biosynthesis